MTAASLLKKFPERLVEKAVKGMLPKNKLGKKLFGNLHVYVGETHDKEAQKPKKVEFN
jgi:large subunit ribosomal protein L13